MAMLAMNAATEALRAEFADCLAQCRAPIRRPMGEFAAAELIIPEGKHRDEHFRPDTLPWTRLLLVEIDSARWQRIAITGCIQGGKSYIGYVVPCLYHLFEVREPVVLFAPTMAICYDKWRNEILPAIMAVPRFRAELPELGAGSRGGNVEEIAFRHGPKLKFIPGHGGDEKRSSYTARVIVGTEIDKMDRAGQTSREASPIDQIESRLLSYDEGERQVYIECSTSIEKGAIWSEVTGGTNSRIVVPCPKCREWVTPEREHLVGWQDAPTKRAAGRAARWNCPSCGAEWDDQTRREINQQNKLVHAGQSIDAAGTITGEPPDTDTLGFRWNAFNNLFWSTSSIGSAEWAAARAPDVDGAEKKMLQFYWATPWRPPEWDDTPLDARAVAERKGPLPQGLLPPDTTHLVAFVDLGKYQSWFLLLAARADKTLHIPDYGIIENHADELAVEVAVLTGLREFRELVAHGWAQDGAAGRRLPDRVFVDSGWLPDCVFRLCAESGRGQKNRYLPTLGRGASVYRSARYTAPKRTGNEVRKIGAGWYLARVPRVRGWQITFNADQHKLAIQDACRRPIGEPGAVTLFDATGHRHNKLSRHLTSERLVRRFVRGKGEVEQWEKSGANHWLDCGAGALMGLNFAGFSLVQASAAPAAAAGTRPERWMSQRKKRARR